MAYYDLNNPMSENVSQSEPYIIIVLYYVSDVHLNGCKVVFNIFLVSRYGRRLLLLVSYLSTIVFALFSAFSTSYIMFVVARFFTGVSLSGINIISFVLSKYANAMPF